MDWGVMVSETRIMRVLWARGAVRAFMCALETSRTSTWGGGGGG